MHLRFHLQPVGNHRCRDGGPGLLRPQPLSIPSSLASELTVNVRGVALQVSMVLPALLVATREVLPGVSRMMWTEQTPSQFTLCTEVGGDCECAALPDACNTHGTLHVEISALPKTAACGCGHDCMSLPDVHALLFCPGHVLG
jgi:hypothetical protein